jgi:hypothetical protein
LIEYYQNYFALDEKSVRFFNPGRYVLNYTDRLTDYSPAYKNGFISKSDLRANISGDGHYFLAMAITQP